MAAWIIGRQRPFQRSTVPLIYLACLAGSLLRPLAAGPDTASGLLMATLAAGLPVAGYLFVLQILHGNRPKAAQFLTFLAPAAVPVFLLAATLAQVGQAEGLCVPGLTPCVPVDPILGLFNILSGASILLLVWLLHGHAWSRLRTRPADRHRYALLLSIIGMHVLILSIDLLRLNELIQEPRAAFAVAVLLLAVTYFMGTLLFRLPQVGPVGETVPVAGPRKPPAEGTAQPALSDPMSAAAGPGTMSAAADPGSVAVAERAEAAPTSSPVPALATRPDAANAGERKPATAALLADEDRKLLTRIEELMTLDKLYQDQGLNRRQLADELGIAEHHLSRLLNSGRGESFTSMVNSFRTAEAIYLLTHSDQAITEVAYSVGFNSLATFNRVFKARTGCSASEYRRLRTGQAA